MRRVARAPTNEVAKQRALWRIAALSGSADGGPSDGFVHGGPPFVRASASRGPGWLVVVPQTLTDAATRKEGD